MSSSDTNIIDTKQSEKSNNRKGNDTPSDGRTSIRYLRELNMYDRTKSNNTILIAGFPGPGLVGSIGANYIIEKLDMHQIACIDSEFIVPGVIYIGGKLKHSAGTSLLRIFYEHYQIGKHVICIKSIRVKES